jgi:hypothetical protein
MQLTCNYHVTSDQFLITNVMLSHDNIYDF